MTLFRHCCNYRVDFLLLVLVLLLLGTHTPSRPIFITGSLARKTSQKDVKMRSSTPHYKLFVLFCLFCLFCLFVLLVLFCLFVLFVLFCLLALNMFCLRVKLLQMKQTKQEMKQTKQAMHEWHSSILCLFVTLSGQGSL